MKKIVLATILTTLTACHNVPAWKYSMFERPLDNRQYPELYVKGWQDGCESGAEASANHLYRFRYKFRQDWRMLNNTLYVNGWENAYTHCRKYVLQHNLRKIKTSG
ncbi:hypothetical protein N9W34_07090 [Rickettsiales bacterium]|nr:hypothetical protein [Rickettsiales bacterium]